MFHRMKVALVVVFALCFVQSVLGWTLQRDVDALKLLREEVEWRDPQWASMVSGWSGGGDWGKDDPCGLGWYGNWEGIQCRGQENLPPHVPRVVTNIHMTDRGLTGPLPLAIVLLKDVIEIDFDGNRITGPLNPYISCMDKLEELDVANNDVHGTIPSEWSQLSKLTEVELETNPKLYGCIPQGMPKVTTSCKKENGNSLCELMGTITFETAVKGFCPNPPNAGKRCADYWTVKRFIQDGKKYDEFYKSYGDSTNGQKPGDLELHQG